MSLNKRETDFLNNLKHDTLKLITKVDKLEQQIINLNAKYKHHINEIMLILENNKNDKPLWNALQNVETRVNAIEDAAILEQEQSNQNASQPEKWVIEKKGRYPTNADEVAVVTTYTNALGGQNKRYTNVSKARQRTKESNKEYIKVRNK